MLLEGYVPRGIRLRLRRSKRSSELSHLRDAVETFSSSRRTKLVIGTNVPSCLAHTTLWSCGRSLAWSRTLRLDVHWRSELTTRVLTNGGRVSSVCLGGLSEQILRRGTWQYCFLLGRPEAGPLAKRASSYKRPIRPPKVIRNTMR